MITNIIQALMNAGDAVLGMLPVSPFIRMEQIALDNQVLGWISWFIPFDAIIGLLNAWLAAIVVWYFSKKTLRWAKIIS